MGAAGVHAFVGVNGPYWTADLDGDGNISWALPDGGTYVTGQFTDTATFGKDEANQTTLISPNPSTPDIYLAKYDADGALVWAKRAGGTGWDVMQR